VFITSTARVSKHHPVNISFLKTTAADYRATIGIAVLEAK